MENMVLLLAGSIEEFRGIAREIRENCVCEVILVADGSQVVQEALECKPRLICLDQDLAGLDGVTCCEMLKRTELLEGIPVILIAATAHLDNLNHCKSTGSDAVLTRPLNYAQLLGIGQTLLTGGDRREVRIHCRITVEFRLNHLHQYGTCWNLGVHGMYIAYDGPVSVGDMVEMGFVVSDIYPSVVEVCGRVVWINKTPQGVREDLPEGFGVEFTVIPEDAQSIIRRFIAEI
ncbi:MAG: response regulator [Geobacter sp.]|nr:response regulator [Geobacter sp.]